MEQEGILVIRENERENNELSLDMEDWKVTTGKGTNLVLATVLQWLGFK